MVTLSDIQAAADQLSAEERAGLVAHLLAAFPSPPCGADDDEVNQRDLEMDSGAVKPLTHEEFLSAVGRR